MTGQVLWGVSAGAVLVGLLLRTGFIALGGETGFQPHAGLQRVLETLLSDKLGTHVTATEAAPEREALKQGLLGTMKGNGPVRPA